MTFYFISASNIFSFGTRYDEIDRKHNILKHIPSSDAMMKFYKTLAISVLLDRGRSKELLYKKTT